MKKAIVGHWKKLVLVVFSILIIIHLAFGFPGHKLGFNFPCGFGLNLGNSGGSFYNNF
jgi:hypothetical protein